MNVARPISPKEYKEFHDELYSIKSEAGRESVTYRIALDEDPTRIPLNISANLSKVQSYMERVVVMLNRGILASAYWQTAVKQMKSKFDAEFTRILMSSAAQGAAKNADGRKAYAESNAAAETIMALVYSSRKAEEIPPPESRIKYEDRLFQCESNLADAVAFKEETQNLFRVLETASTSLAVQQKNSVYSRALAGAGASADDVQVGV